MKKDISKFTYLTIWMVISLVTTAAAQSTEVEMADVMRSNGKIYVVVTVAAIVLTGIFVYLIRLERKVSAIEKKLSEKSEK
ncbi:MAG TPA: hypothetical protein VFW78_00015 [Bacteroidia bacterium]|nr:hypothetical protein [Bacteroidia bacterium]